MEFACKRYNAKVSPLIIKHPQTLQWCAVEYRPLPLRAIVCSIVLHVEILMVVDVMHHSYRETTAEVRARRTIHKLRIANLGAILQPR